jgi:hypothetical protein
MKVAAEFNNVYDAEIAKGRLASEGIQSVIMNVSSPYPGVQMGRHGIQLMVNEEDLETAQMILDRAV